VLSGILQSNVDINTFFYAIQQQVDDSRFGFLIRRESQVTEDRIAKEKREIKIISRAKNARQCTLMESAMRYWKCIRYPVSREFTASGYAVFYEVGRRMKWR